MNSQPGFSKSIGSEKLTNPEQIGASLIASHKPDKTCEGLNRVAEIWPKLSEPIRQAILTIVESASNGDGDGAWWKTWL